MIPEMTTDMSTSSEPKTALTWGAGWILAEDYPSLLSLMPDMPPTFEAWLAGATGRIAGAKAKGYAVYRAPLDAVRFRRWCAERGLGHDAASRQAFASDDINWDREAPL